jgi:hypothetical protein
MIQPCDLRSIQRLTNDYNFYANCHPDRSIWGAGILLNKRHNGKVIHWQKSTEPGRAVMVVVQIKGRTTMIISVYLPTNPSSSESENISNKIELEIEQWLMTASNMKYDIIMGGDFNVNLHDPHHNRATRIRHLCQRYDLEIGLDGTVPTHDKNGAIDNICFTRKGMSNVKSGVESRNLPIHSDHRPVYVQYEVNDKTLGNNITYYSYDGKDLERAVNKAEELITEKGFTEPLLEILQKYYKESIEVSLIPQNGKGGANRTKGWANGKIQEITNRMSRLDYARRSITKTRSDQCYGELRQIIITECKSMKVTFKEENIRELRISALKAWFELQKCTNSELKLLKTSHQRSLEEFMWKSSKQIWRTAQPFKQGYSINKLRIENEIVADPIQLHKFIEQEFTKWYRQIDSIDPKNQMSEEIEKLLEKTSKEWPEEVLKEFTLDITE